MLDELLGKPSSLKEHPQVGTTGNGIN